MLIFDGKESVKQTLSKIGCLDFDKNIDLLINGVSLSALNILNTSTTDAELWLFMFWNDPRSFMSFKEKIKYSLHNWVKVHFSHLLDNEAWINTWIIKLNEVISTGWKVIIQLPIADPNIQDFIQNMPDSADIDNLKWNKNKYGCTQSAIMGFTHYVIWNWDINNISVIWSEWFIGKWIYEWLKKDYPYLNIQWLDKKHPTPLEEEWRIISNTDLIVSTASESFNYVSGIKENTSAIDCWLIRWKLWLRGSLPMQKDSMKNYNIITPVPWGIWPLEMMYMVWKNKGLTLSDLDSLLAENIVLTELNI